MNILQISKYPPIQGGVSAECFWFAQSLSELGHRVTVLTNAGEVENSYKLEWLPTDVEFCARKRGRYPVEVFSTLPDENHYYIPQGNPTTSKLISKGLEIVENTKPDFIYSCYLEPYGVAAAFISSVTKTPHVAAHAGSDVGRLFKTPSLTRCYRAVFDQAAAIVTNKAADLGIPKEKTVPSRSIRIRSDLFYPLPPFRRQNIVLGIFGKVGKRKGTYELIEAIGNLVSRGFDIELRALWGGKGVTAVQEAIKTKALENEVKVASFIPHWRIPNFIRECDAILYLENSFPILDHYPLVPLEALCCGRPVLLTEEIAEKGIYRTLSKSGAMLIIPSPFSVENLESAIEELILGMPTFQLHAMKAIDSYALGESAVWNLSERVAALSQLCNCSTGITL